MSTWETRAVEVVVELPVELAEDVEEVQGRDPDFLGKAIQYALARRIIFQELSRELGRGLGGRPGERPGWAGH